MSKVLYIVANPKPVEASYTLKMAEKFLEEYRKNNPGDEVNVLNLYNEDLRPLSTNDLNDLFTNPTAEIKKYVNDFITYDKYIFAAPLWNLSIPAILKMYIDYLLVPGITFKYTESGAVGLLADKGKKVLFFAARGGYYGEEPYSSFEYGEKYLRTITGFVGLTDFTTIALEKTNMLPQEEVNKELEKKYIEIEKLAKEF